MQRVWQGAICRLWIRRPASDIDLAVTTEVGVFQEGQRDLQLEVFGKVKGTSVKRSSLQPFFITRSLHPLQERGGVSGRYRQTQQPRDSIRPHSSPNHLDRTALGQWRKATASKAWRKTLNPKPLGIVILSTAALYHMLSDPDPVVFIPCAQRFLVTTRAQVRLAELTLVLFLQIPMGRRLHAAAIDIQRYARALSRPGLGG